MTHFFSDKPHLLKVPQSPKIAPLSREHWFEIQAGISTGERFRFKPHISCNHLQSPYSPLPQKEPLPSARLGRFHNGNLSRSLSLFFASAVGSLSRQALQGCTGGLGKMSVTQPHGMSPARHPPHCASQVSSNEAASGALLPVKLLVSLPEKRSFQNHYKLVLALFCIY